MTKLHILTSSIWDGLHIVLIVPGSLIAVTIMALPILNNNFNLFG